MATGVYEIRNTVTGACYVGSAMNLNLRWKAHRGHLRRGTHHSRYLQNSFNVHGSSADVLSQRYWMNHLKQFASTFAGSSDIHTEMLSVVVRRRNL